MSTNQINNNRRDKRITAEQTILLIRLIKKYKCLWNANSTDFRNRSVCNELYEKIGGYFKITGEEVRRKFRRIKNSYMQELKQMRNDQKAYTNLFYFDEMEFLKDQIEQRLLRRSSLSGSTVSRVKEENDLDGLPIESFEECYTIEQPDDLHLSSETESHPGVSIETLDTSEISAYEQPDMKEIACDFEGKSDEFDTFAEYLASQLREMDKLSALETMDELQRIVSHRRIEILKRDIKRKSFLDAESSQSHKKSRMSNV